MAIATANRTAVELLREQFKGAHEWLEGTIEGVTDEQATWIPQGKPSPIGAQYAHTVTGEDAVLAQGMGKTPLMLSNWAGRTGLSELPGMGAWDEWGRRASVDLIALRAYARAVYAATESYLDDLTDDDLSRELDIGWGKMTLGSLFYVMVANANNHTGEISCLKGLQGLKGYPM